MVRDYFDSLNKFRVYMYTNIPRVYGEYVLLATNLSVKNRQPRNTAKKNTPILTKSQVDIIQYYNSLLAPNA